MTEDKDRLHEAAQQLNSAAIHLLRGMRAVDRLSGLTAARLSALSVLVFGGEHNLTELAAAQDVTSPTMTRIVQGLVAAGLVERGPDPRSAREVRIVATAAGTALMQEAARRRIDVIAQALGELAASDRATLIRAAPLLVSVSASVPQLAQAKATTAGRTE